jgi:hypothetical protein
MSLTYVKQDSVGEGKVEISFFVKIRENLLFWSWSHGFQTWSQPRDPSHASIYQDWLRPPCQMLVKPPALLESGLSGRQTIALRLANVAPTLKVRLAAKYIAYHTRPSMQVVRNESTAQRRNKASCTADHSLSLGTEVVS